MNIEIIFLIAGIVLAALGVLVFYRILPAGKKQKTLGGIILNAEFYGILFFIAGMLGILVYLIERLRPLLIKEY